MSSTLFLPQKTINRMYELGITEDEIYEVYNFGDHNKTTTGSMMAVKTFTAGRYEIGFFYVEDSLSRSKYAVTGVWKKNHE